MDLILLDNSTRKFRCPLNDLRNDSVLKCVKLLKVSETLMININSALEEKKGI